MKLTDTTANVLTTTSFLSAATSVSIQYNELAKFGASCVAILSGLIAFAYYAYKIYKLSKQ